MYYILLPHDAGLLKVQEEYVIKLDVSGTCSGQVRQVCVLQKIYFYFNYRLTEQRQIFSPHDSTVNFHNMSLNTHFASCQNVVQPA